MASHQVTNAFEVDPASTEQPAITVNGKPVSEAQLVQEPKTSTALSTPTPAIKSKPKNVMASTWHQNDPSTWSRAQRILHKMGALQFISFDDVPVYKDSDPIPYFPIWKQHLWMGPRAVAPLIVHYAIIKTFGSFHPVAAFVFYTFWMAWLGLATIRHLAQLTKKYGFLDGQKARDGIPDVYGGKVFWSLAGTVSIRPMFALFAIYDRYEVPTLSWWLPVQMFMYAIVLDFFFYWYHRVMHEVPWLWKFHRLHHVTKHPQAALSPFADNVQEWFDILIIPLMTYAVCRPNFATWWMSTSYILYTEAMGHSGLRIYWPTPLTGDILRVFDAELALEDHDLHHRRGWKKAVNYGKQTRLWDRIFGTSGERVECTQANIDYKYHVDPWN